MAGIDGHALWRLADVLKSAMPAPKQTDRATARLSYVDDEGIGWYRIEGSSIDTPCVGGEVADVQPGEQVEVEIRGGMLYVTGNDDSPSVGENKVASIVDRAVVPVRTRAVQAMEESAIAKAIADAAKRVAEATEQHFWTDTNGIHVTHATQKDWETSQSGPNLLLNSVGQLFRDGLNNLVAITTEQGARAISFYDGSGNAAGNITAIFSSALMRMGYASGNRVEVDSNGVYAKSGSGNNYTAIDSSGFKTYLSNVLRMALDSTALKVYDGSGTAAANVLASFGSSGGVVGKPSGFRTVMNSSGLHVYDANANLAIELDSTYQNVDSLKGGSVQFKPGYTYASSVEGIATNTKSNARIVAHKVDNAALPECSAEVTCYADNGTPTVNIMAEQSGTYGLLQISKNRIDIQGASAYVDNHSLITTSSSIGHNTTLSDDTGGTGLFFRELTGSDNIAIVRSYGRSGADRRRGLQIGGRNINHANWNLLCLTTDKDGKRYVQVSESKPWRDAINPDPLVTSNPSAVNVPTSSWSTLGSITLGAGTWCVSISTTFASNSNGRRAVYFDTSSTGTAVGVSGMGSSTMAPAVGGQTKYSNFHIADHTSSTTYYCRVWQNSGSTLSCQCYLRAVRIV